jgi:hypothetical protein
MLPLLQPDTERITPVEHNLPMTGLQRNLLLAVPYGFVTTSWSSSARTKYLCHHNRKEP